MNNDYVKEFFEGKKKKEKKAQNLQDGYTIKPQQTVQENKQVDWGVVPKARKSTSSAVSMVDKKRKVQFEKSSDIDDTIKEKVFEDAYKAAQGKGFSHYKADVFAKEPADPYKNDGFLDEFFSNGEKYTDKEKNNEWGKLYSSSSKEFPKYNPYSGTWTQNQKDDLEASRYPHRKEKTYGLSVYPKYFDHKFYDDEDSYEKALGEKEKREFYNLKDKIKKENDDFSFDDSYEKNKNAENFKKEKDRIVSIWAKPVDDKKAILQEAEQKYKNMDSRKQSGEAVNAYAYNVAKKARDDAENDLYNEKAEIKRMGMDFAQEEALEKEDISLSKSKVNQKAANSQADVSTKEASRLEKIGNQSAALQEEKDYQLYLDVKAGKVPAPDLLSHTQEAERWKKWQEYGKIADTQAHKAKLKAESEKARQEAQKPTRFEANVAGTIADMGRGGVSVVQDQVGNATIALELGVNGVFDAANNYLSPEMMSNQNDIVRAQRTEKEYKAFLEGERWDDPGKEYHTTADAAAARKKDITFAEKNPAEYSKEVKDNVDKAHKKFEDNKQETQLTENSLGIKIKASAEENWDAATRNMSPETKKVVTEAVDCTTDIIYACINPILGAGAGVINGGSDKIYESVKSGKIEGMSELEEYLTEIPAELGKLVVGKAAEKLNAMVMKEVPNMSKEQKQNLKASMRILEESLNAMIDDVEAKAMEAEKNKTPKMGR